jgi:hypothetical protein
MKYFGLMNYDTNSLDLEIIQMLRLICLFVRLFVCIKSHEQFFSYLATFTIIGDRAANLDLYA